VERFSQDTQILNGMKIRQVGAELFHVARRGERRTDGQTYRQTWKSFAIMRMRLKIVHSIILYVIDIDIDIVIFDSEGKINRGLKTSVSAI
jgi:hypothetical protein